MTTGDDKRQMNRAQASGIGIQGWSGFAAHASVAENGGWPGKPDSGRKAVSQAVGAITTKWCADDACAMLHRTPLRDDGTRTRGSAAYLSHGEFHSMGVRAKPGDVFSIPLGDKGYGVGVVAAKWQSELYLVVFSETVTDASTLANRDVNTLTPMFASSTLDAKLWHGHWQIVKHCESLSGIQQPIYKVQVPSGWVAESFDRKFQISVGEDVAAKLRFRKCVAPIRLERGLKAHVGDGDWLPTYDDLLYREVLNSREVLSKE